MEQLKLLWELQETEEEKAKKEHDLPSIPSVLQYGRNLKKVGSLEKKVLGEENRIGEIKKAQRLQEMDVAKITAQLKELNRKLYNGKIGNIKELENMEKKVGSLAKEKELLEDEIIVHMEMIENLENELGRMQKQLKKEKEIVDKLRAEALMDRQAALSELGELAARCENLSQKIEVGLLNKYKELRKRAGGGRCISLVRNGFCGICNVSLPSSFRARLLTPGQLVYCENCASLLVLDK
ncbi:MAG: zinc ribbon domain-containing protein [Dethiobacteria bacterium]|jgi:predicted  nucleic acid-binding Zn-ribbon protein